MPGPKTISIKDRFFRHIKKTKTCWLWTANTYRCGYGQLGIGSRSSPPRKKVGAHRLSYEIHYGFIPKGMFVLHRCNLKICVNPEHLYIGDQRQNILDAKKDGLMKKSKKFRESRTGVKNPAARFDEIDIQSIRRMYRSGLMTQMQLAIAHKTSQSHIGRIVRRQAWIHI